MPARAALKYIFCLLVLSPGSLCFSQTFSYHSYNVNDGLPSSQVYDILQDRDKFVWIATDRGVSRFDGYIFTNYAFAEGLLDNTVYKLYEDGFGRIWFLSYYGKLCYWQDGKIIPFKYNHLFKEKPSYGQVRIASFSVSRDSTILIGSIPAGSKKIFPDGTMQTISQLPETGADTYVLDEREDGIVSYSTITSFLDRWSISLKKNDKEYYKKVSYRGLRYKNPFYLQRKNKTLLYTLFGEILEAKQGKVLDSCRLPSDVISVYEDSDSCLWMGFMDGGIRRYTPNCSATFDTFSLFFPQYQISKVMEDYEHGFWFATLHNGILYVPSSHIENIYDEAHSLLKENNVSMTSDRKSKLFIGTDKGTLKILRGAKQTEHMDIVGPGNKDIINVLYYDKDVGDLIVCGYKTVYKMSGRKIKRASGRSALCIEKDEVTGNYYAGAYTGIIKYLGSRMYGHIVGQGRKKIRVWALCYDVSGKLWAGSTDGLYYKENDSLVKKNIPGLDCRVTSIIRSGQNLYIGTVGKGIILFDSNSKTGEYTVANGLASSIVNSIEMQNDSTLWAITPKGVCRINTKRKEINLVLNSNNGLYTNEVMDIEILHDTVYLLSHDAVSYFDPGKVKPNIVRPRVYITDCTIDAESYIKEHAPELEYDKNYITFHYVGLSYKSRGKVKYKYRLAGYKNNWQTTESNSIFFPYLPAGNYTFEVYALNEDGVESRRPAQFSFSIKHPFWERTGFILSSSLVTILLVIWVFAVRAKRSNEKKDMLLQLTEMRQKALSMQMNPHFIYNSLNSIQGFVLNEEPYMATKYLSKFSRLMRMSLNNIKSDFVNVSEEIGLVELYLELEQMRFPRNFTFSLKIAENIPSHIRIPPMLIQPLTENAIKHGINRSAANGTVKVSLYMNENILYCEVDDNGKGIDAALKSKEPSGSTDSTGIATTVQRLKLFCEKYKYPFLFEVKDKSELPGNGTGTRILFIIPYI
jgi:ligand-binding sensor domain-containing protein